MMFFNIGMGRVWSLYFMLQLVTNFENYEKLIPAPSTKEFLQFLEEISNFKISEIKQVYHFFSYDNNKSQNLIFAQNEMIFSLICFSTILALTWGVRKNWNTGGSIKHFKRLMVWSPFFRCIMMTWFATALWTFTWFHASVDGFSAGRPE